MANNGEESEEERLLNVLSSLASAEPPKQPHKNVVSWLASQLDSPSQSQKENDGTWTTSLQTISNILPTIEPRDLHSVAVQAIVFSDAESSFTHVYLCLLLCARALNSCPPQLERWKRWRSLLCEGISLYQRYVLVDEDEEGMDWEEATRLWLHHVLPSCQHVERCLPREVNRIPLAAGMISVASHLSTRTLSSGLQHELVSSTYDTCLCRDSRNDVWNYPWHVYEHQEYDGDESSQNQEELWWWTIDAECEDSVAGMDTVWNEYGIAILAFLAYNKERKLYSPTETWNLWFPHTSVLLNNVNPILKDDYILNVMESLLQQQEPESMNIVNESPTNPFATLQLLLNRTMLPSSDKSRVVATIKSLLSIYTRDTQVDIVSRLMDACPHEGLKPRLLDLLRPIATHGIVKEYLSTFVDTLLTQHLRNDELVNVEELINQVEVYVSVVSLIQLRIMLQKEDGCGLEEAGRLSSFLTALTTFLQDDTTNEGHFRLNLLENALQQVVALYQEQAEQT